MFVFDAYGTLLDVDAAAREAAAEPGMEALKENWDVSGAGAFGFKTIWVNRTGVVWDNLTGKPDIIVNSISEAQLNI